VTGLGAYATGRCRYDGGVRATRVVKFTTFAEADQADKWHYLQMTPERRLEIVAELRGAA
jgi:hypothetical protein